MLAFVEGSMERQFINANFKYIRVVSVSNGITWTVERLCEQITTSYKAFDYNGETFVWVDREGREATAGEIRADIQQSLLNAGADPDRLHVLVNDRTSENVILADEDAIRDEFDKPDFIYTYEGQNGKRYVKDLYRESGDVYKEMVQGVRLLKKIRLSKSALNSPCVNDFVSSVNTDCWWI